MTRGTVCFEEAKWLTSHFMAPVAIGVCTSGTSRYQLVKQSQAREHLAIFDIGYEARKPERTLFMPTHDDALGVLQG